MIELRFGERAVVDPAAVVPRLRECHAKIRTFLAEATAIADSYRTAVDPARRARSARNVIDYFTLALPLHEADEDASIAPRLEKDDLRWILEEHGVIDRLLDALVSDWRQIAKEGGPLPDLERHKEQLDALDRLLRRHLDAEERELFPRIDALPWAERLEIVHEMRQRRA